MKYIIYLICFFGFTISTYGNLNVTIEDEARLNKKYDELKKKYKILKIQYDELVTIHTELKEIHEKLKTSMSNSENGTTEGNSDASESDAESSEGDTETSDDESKTAQTVGQNGVAFNENKELTVQYLSKFKFFSEKSRYYLTELAKYKAKINLYNKERNKFLKMNIDIQTNE